MQARLGRLVFGAADPGQGCAGSLYRIPEEDVLSIIYFPNALAIKATIVRPLPSGALGERDVYGAQQHAPLVNFAFEL